MSKYKVGQVVWFYTQACSGDDCLVKYPCISRGRITSIYPAGSSHAYDRREVEYGMQGTEELMAIEESNVFPDSVDKAFLLRKIGKLNWGYNV